MNFTVKDREGRGGLFKMGEGCKIDPSVSIDTSANVTLENRVIISDGALILTHEHDKYDPMNKGKITATPLIIMDDAFIGARAIITASVKTIGKKATIGAGAVVTKNVPENSVMAGNPAKIIGWKHDRQD